VKSLRFRHPARGFLARSLFPRRLSFICSSFLPVLLLTVLWLFGPARGALADVTIIVEAAETQGYINPLVFGQNVLFDSNTMWDQTTDTLKADADDSKVIVKYIIEELAPTILRFPGGIASDLYLWEDGLGFRTLEVVDGSSTSILLDDSPYYWRAGKGLLIDPGGGQIAYENLKGQLGDHFDFNGLDTVNNRLTGVSNLNVRHGAGALVRPGGRPLGKIPGRLSENYWTNTYGIVEHLKLVNSLGAQALLTVNCGTGLDSNGLISRKISLDQRIMRSQALVAYCNGTTAATPLGIDGEGRDWRTVAYWAGKRGVDAQGATKPPFGVKYWEVGNEPYAKSDAGYSVAGNYAENFKKFAQKMKEVDPTITVGAAGLNLPTWHGDGDPDPWNETVVRETINDLDFLVIHSYYPTIQSPMDYTSDAWFKLVMAGATQAWQDLTEIRGIIDNLVDANSPGRNIGLAVTEYGFWAPGGAAKDHANLARALYDADLLMYLIKGSMQLRLLAAAAWDLHGGNSGAAIKYNWPLIYTNSGSRIIRPQYYALKMLRQSLASRQLVKTEVLSSPAFSIDAKVGNINPNPAVPCLEALGARSPDGRRLTLVVINRSLDSYPQATITANIQLNNLLLTPKSATVTQLTSAHLWDHNEEGEVVKPSVLTLAPVPQSFNFPPHSLTIIEFRPVSLSGAINLLLNFEN
jgi:alpha-L-arabinofuranosidase